MATGETDLEGQKLEIVAACEADLNGKGVEIEVKVVKVMQMVTQE